MPRGILLLAITIVLFVTAGDATIAAPATPVPDACSVDPVDPEHLQEIVAAGVAATPEVITSGQQVSAVDLVHILDVVTESVACANANDPLRSMALYTDRYLAMHFAGQAGEDELGHLLAASTRKPVPATPSDQLVLLAVTNAIAYQDSRIGVTVITANADNVFTDLLILENTDSGWRIDQVALDAGATPAATPADSSQG